MDRGGIRTSDSTKFAKVIKTRRDERPPAHFEAGNASNSCLIPMTLDTQMTLALLQELLMALRANDADGYKSWLALGIEELGREVAGEVESE